MEINGGNALSKVLSDYALPEQKKGPSKDLGRDEFLKLLIAQLQNQDPTSPQDNGEFVAQLAQFSSLEESQKMTQSFQQFASSFQSTQHLQATSLVGRPVHVLSDVTMLTDAGAVSVVADFDNAVQSASLSVYDKQGQLVDKFALGPQEAGKQEFYWTGTDANDQRYPSGEYRFELSASNGGESTTLPTYLSANVNSVTIEKSGNLTLNLAGVGSVSMSEVIQIN
jgi:flagellar basal-body rod modification protein FlgD